jgi:predicted ATP-binding protein involved in virulence
MKINKIEWRNFSSYGNKKQILEFDETASLVQIVGENGSGKCFSPDTKIVIKCDATLIAKLMSIK